MVFSIDSYSPLPLSALPPLSLGEQMTFSNGYNAASKSCCGDGGVGSWLELFSWLGGAEMCPGANNTILYFVMYYHLDKYIALLNIIHFILIVEV